MCFLKKIRIGKSSLGNIINVYGSCLDGEAILGIKKVMLILVDISILCKMDIISLGYSLFCMRHKTQRKLFLHFLLWWAHKHRWCWDQKRTKTRVWHFRRLEAWVEHMSKAPFLRVLSNVGALGSPSLAFSLCLIFLNHPSHIASLSPYF